MSRRYSEPGGGRVRIPYNPFTKTKSQQKRSTVEKGSANEVTENHRDVAFMCSRTWRLPRRGHSAVSFCIETGDAQKKRKGGRPGVPGVPPLRDEPHTRRTEGGDWTRTEDHRPVQTFLLPPPILPTGDPKGWRTALGPADRSLRPDSLDPG